MNLSINPLISVIVPVYNVEEYVARCLDSILQQTYTNYEIIVIDDGSTDSSGMIVDEYRKKSKKISVKHIKNNGVSNARNIGIDLSLGTYLCFVDSDDWLEETMLETMLDLSLQYDCDIVQTGYIQTDRICFFKRHQNNFFGCLEGTEKILELYSKEIIHNSICTKLFKKSIIGKTRLKTELSVGEDAQFTFELCKKSRKVFLSDLCLYNYYQRNESIVHSKCNLKLLDILSVLQSQMNDVKNLPIVFDHLRYRKDKNIIRLYQMFAIARQHTDVCKGLRKELKSEISFYRKMEKSKKERIRAFLICYLHLLIDIKIKLFSN